MSTHHGHQVHVVINHTRISFDEADQTGRSIKQRAGIPQDHLLCVDLEHTHSSHPTQSRPAGSELTVVNDCERIHLKEGEHFFSVAVPVPGAVSVTINRKVYLFEDAHQLGRALKERASIPLTDVLFLDRPQEDEVITDERKVTLKCGDTFHSEPPANYGKPAVEFTAQSVGAEHFDVLPQADDWTFLVVHGYSLPDSYKPASVRLLVKLPPLFPEAAPDMFWVSPEVRLTNGAAPHGSSHETVLGEQWQRFSWHLQPGAWSPGTSTLRDFMRCVRARMEKRN